MSPDAGAMVAICLALLLSALPGGVPAAEPTGRQLQRQIEASEAEYACRALVLDGVAQASVD